MDLTVPATSPFEVQAQSDLVDKPACTVSVTLIYMTDLLKKPVLRSLMAGDKTDINKERS